MFTMQNMSNKISSQLMVERISVFFNCRKSWLGYLHKNKVNDPRRKYRIPTHCSPIPDHFNGLYVNFSCMTGSATFTKTKPNPGEKMASKLISREEMFLRFTFSMLLARLACVYLNRNNANPRQPDDHCAIDWQKQGQNLEIPPGKNCLIWISVRKIFLVDFLNFASSFVSC